MYLVTTEAHPFGECSTCETEFNSELANEYALNIEKPFGFCPYCGEKFSHHKIIHVSYELKIIADHRAGNIEPIKVGKEEKAIINGYLKWRKTQ